MAKTMILDRLPLRRIMFALIFALTSSTRIACAGEMEMIDDVPFWRRADSLSDRIEGARTVGQAFISSFPNLSRIDVRLHLDSDAGSGGLILRLRSSPSSDRDIAVAAIDHVKSGSDGYYAFRFPPVSDSNGREFYFFLESKDGKDSGLRVWFDPRTVLIDKPHGRRRYENHAAVEGSLAFQPYCAFLEDGRDVKRAIWNRLTADPVFFILHLCACVGVFAGLIILSRKSRVKSQTESGG